MDAEKEAEKAGQPIRYPTADELRAEADEEAPAILLTVSDADRHAGARGHRADCERDCSAWRGTCARRRISCRRTVRAARSRSSSAIALVGPYVVPGKYSVTLSQRVGGVVSQLAGPVTFNVVLDPQGAHTAADQTARWQFQEKLQALRRDIAGALELANSTDTRLEAIRKALDATPAAPRTLHDQARALSAAARRRSSSSCRAIGGSGRAACRRRWRSRSARTRSAAS